MKSSAQRERWCGIRSPGATPRDGWHGWDEYAAFYDWENARTIGRRDVAFWRQIAKRERPPVLELGCGTGRLLGPLAGAAWPVVGVDRSRPMLARARARVRPRVPARRPSLARADIRALPFAANAFGLLIAPYGMLQSLLRDRDVRAVLAEARRVLVPGGLLGIDLVPELPRWREYGPTVRLQGPGGRGVRITLVESVRQDRRRRLTMFDEVFTVTRGRREARRRFRLTFRTPPMSVTLNQLTRAGFRIDAVLGDYRGRAWHARADACVILARKA